jgi:lysophospholipase L1-like esterase
LPDQAAAADKTSTVRDVPRGRRGRTIAALVGVALVVVLACLRVGAVHLARSTRAGPRSELASSIELVRKPQGNAQNLVASRHQRMRKGPARVAPRKRVTRYGIAFFGDSVSVGAGASDRKHGYVARVSGRLRILGKRVIQTVYAKGGVPVAYWEHAPIPRKLDAAVVELGTNDVRLGTSSAQFADDYRALTSRIREANPRVQLLCLSVWSHRGGERLAGGINAQIRAICPGTYVDITRFRDRPHIRSSDGFHPNNIGYRLIARAVESKLKPI